MKKGRLCVDYRLIMTGCMSLCMVLVTTAIRCQQTVPTGRFHLQGKVIDAQNNQPLAAATISIRAKGDSTETAQAICNQSGDFSADIIPGDYILQASYSGYSPINIHVQTGTTLPVHDIGTIKLSTSQMLKEVIVSGEKNDMEIAADKRIFNIESSLAAKGGTAIDALRVIPSVLISASGRVSLRDGVPVILIDGKKTSLNLNQIAADQIQSIEVITNPSAKYDAQGNRGFINIIMKTEKKVGLNAIVRTSFNTQNAYSTGFDGNVRKGKVNVSVSYFNRKRKDVSRISVNRQYPDQRLFASVMDKSGTEYFQRGKIGLDYFMNRNNTFNMDGDMAGGHEDYTNFQNASYISSVHLNDSSSVRLNPLREEFTVWHLNVNYTHRFKREDEKLILYAGNEGYDEPAAGAYSMQFISKEGIVYSKPFLQNYAVNFHTNLVTLQADYSRPLRKNKGKLETGLKVTLHHGNNDNLLSDYSYDSLKYVSNNKASYAFIYKDPTYAGYANYSDQHGIFGYIAGIRVEDYNYSGMLPDGSKIVSYHNRGVFPGVFLTWKLPSGSKVRLNYSRRVRRPVFSEISPVTDYTDPQNLLQGNNLLRPEYTHLFELSYNRSFSKTTVAGTLYFRDAQNLITTYTYAIAPDTLLTTYINAKGGATGGAELIVKHTVTSWFTVTGSLNVLHSDIRADNINKNVSNKGFTWFGKITSDMKLPDALTLQLTGNYVAPAIVPQGKTRSGGGLDISLGKLFLKNKALSVDCSMFDVFNTNREKTGIEHTGIFIQTSLNKPRSRLLRVSCSYRFKK